MLGFSGVTAQSLYKLFKRRKGRPIEKPEDIPDDVKFDIPIELLIRIFNDPEVQAQLRKTIDPLHQNGIEEFQTRRQGQTIDRVSKRDLQAADDAEVESLTKDEEVELDIQKAALRRNLSWHLSDKRTSFDSRIEDNAFWKRIEQGEAFADGDRLRVHLKTTARRTSNGLLKVERIIPKVIEVEQLRRIQRKLFEEEQEP